MSNANPHLASWLAMCEHVMSLTSEDELEALLQEEVSNANRGSYVKRIYHRISVLRRDREKDELGVKPR